MKVCKISKYILVLITFSVTTASGIVLAKSPVGSDQGNIEITNSGEALYTLPITAPPGVLGLAPKLTLSVSQTGQLNMGGLSSITRCSGLHTDFGQSRPVQLLPSDQYCLDGAPLVLIEGDQGSPGSIYHTKIESFQKVEAVNQKGKGPESFKVTTRSGGTLYFGKTALSRSQVNSDATVISWSISSIVDPSGNALWYQYQKTNNNADADVVLKSIVYGSKSESTAPVRVEFDYEANPHPSTTYQFGKLINSTQRLKKITTKADNKTAREFRITYKTAASGSYSQVSKIHECSASGECYRPSQFNYSPILVGWKNDSSITQPSPMQDAQGRSRGVVLDINNDGWQDWLIAVQPETGPPVVQTWLGSKTGWSNTQNFNLPGPLMDYKINSEGIPVGNLVDMNGDGLIDYFKAYRHTRADGSKTSQLKTWLNTGNGFIVNNDLKPRYYTVDILADGTLESLDKYVDINGDGLPDQIRAVRRKDNTISRVTWLNTGAGWVNSNAYKIPGGLFSDHASGVNGIYQGELIDINGDGLVDFVESAKLSDSVTAGRTYINTGNGWRENTDYRMPIALMDYSVFEKGIPNAELVDINGDGLIDVWQALTIATSPDKYNAWLNTGAGFVKSSKYTPNRRSTYVRSNGIVLKYGDLLDVDGDGQPEFVLHSLNESNGNLAFLVYQHDGSNWISKPDLSSYLPSIPIYLQPANGSATQKLLQMADLNGDGSSEAFMSQDKTNGWQVKSALNLLTDANQPGYLSSHINGLGIETRIDYGLSTDSNTFYKPGDSTQNTRRSVAMNAPMILVKSVKKMNGLVHPNVAKSDDQGAGWYAVEHRYGELKMDLTGRGSLGFRTRTIIDQRTGVSVNSEFYQAYPYTGMPYKSTQKLNDVVLSSTQTMEMKPMTLYGGSTVFIYAPQSIAKKFDPKTKKLLSTTTTASTYDEFGNVLTKAQTITGLGQKYTQNTITTYENRVQNGDWVLGLPATTEVTFKANGKPNLTNKTSATYNAKGFPETEILEEGHPQAVKSTYTYGAFGNVTNIAITSGAETRNSKTVYTADGRFPKEIYNALNHKSTVVIDSRWGKPVRQVNANGLVKVTEYDGFGTVVNEDTQWSGSPQQRQSREHAKPYWCENNNNCPANAVYLVGALDDQGESPQAVYYDAYGREILKQTLGADLDGNSTSNGSAIYIATSYDDQGRRHKTSRPGTNKAALIYDTILYDEFGRVKEQSTSDGKTTIEYDGLTTITENSERQKTKVTLDLRGNPTHSEDALSNVTTYVYDAKGNLTETIDVESNKVIMKYDDFGRKIEMIDPDMGHWFYKYDGFGNLIEQKDNKLSITTMEYDALNRMNKRTDDEGGTQNAITTWKYDTADRSEQTIKASGETQYVRIGPALGLLASVSGPKYSRTHTYDQAGRPVKEVTIIDAQSYTSERGYYRASEKVSWEKYPSGLVLTKEYDPSGYPMKLESGDLEKYQASLEKYYEYEKLVYRIGQLEQEHRAELDNYLEQLKGQKTGEDAKGNPVYAGGGLEDQVAPLITKVNQTANEAQNWQAYASEAQKIYSEHSSWYDKYYAEYLTYRNPYDAEIKKGEDHEDDADHFEKLAKGEEAKAKPHEDEGEYHERVAKHWKSEAQKALHQGCKAAGWAIHDAPLAEYADLCMRGAGPIAGLGNARKNWCIRPGNHVAWNSPQCDYWHDVFAWLPSLDSNIGYVHDRIAHMESYVDNYDDNVTKANAAYKKAEPFIIQANKHRKTSQYHVGQANAAYQRANGYVRGVTVYGAITNNHLMVMELLNDTKGDKDPTNDTGRFVNYNKELERLAGKWQCKKNWSGTTACGNIY